MKNNKNLTEPQFIEPEITRSEAMRKIGKYGKYAVLTALGTYIILSPKKAQASSLPDGPGTGF